MADAQSRRNKLTYSDHLYIETHTDGVLIEHHAPQIMETAYHVHPTLEINFLINCQMTYSFGRKLVEVPSEKFCVFWGARPHRVAAIDGVGEIINIYVPLHEFWSWPLPQSFVDALLSGAILTSTNENAADYEIARNWARRRHQNDDRWDRLHMVEVQGRLTRMALDGWKAINSEPVEGNAQRVGGNAIRHFDRMLRFVARNYAEPIGLDDIANAANVSPNYAIQLFKKVLGTTVKAHLSSLRISHAKMLLAETDQKILTIGLDCGFRSQSAFYEAFQKSSGTTPAEFRKSAKLQQSE
ncbi:MAG: helix-turn-helix domain-containing protein [Boseongicola sp.]|nr:MAG: helix-turn-helix domain-containing protein [Boseongicola sp.]